MPFFRRPDIEKLKETRDYQGLIRALMSRNPDVKEAAAVALYELDNSATAPTLIELLRHKNKFVRNGAAYGLGHLRDPQAVGPLEQAWREDEDEMVRVTAFFALDALAQQGITEAQRIGEEARERVRQAEAEPPKRGADDG